jgi:hypothetical protein
VAVSEIRHCRNLLAAVKRSPFDSMKTLVSEHQAAAESLPARRLGYLFEKPERDYGERQPKRKRQ